MAQSEQICITFQYTSNATGNIFASSQSLQEFVSSYTHDDGGSDLILLIMENNTQKVLHPVISKCFRQPEQFILYGFSSECSSFLDQR